MRLALGTALVVLSLAAHGGSNVAFVADITGNATIEGDGKLNFLAELGEGTRLLLGSGATAVVTYASSGTEFTLAGPGEFLVAAAEVRAEKGPKPARRAVTVLPDPGIVARVSQTATASQRMRSAGPTASPGAIVYPIDTRIASLQPELRWRPDAVAGATSVNLAEESGKQVWKGEARQGSARPAVKLSPATHYVWTIMASGGVLAQARFETLPADLLAKAGKSQALARSFSDRVMHAFLLQDIGAHQDAREAWAALARERPDLPQLGVLAR